MAKELLMGNEAIGLGAIHAGVGLVSGYPGTPSTEILETVARYNDDGRIHVEWSVNEGSPGSGGRRSLCGSENLSDHEAGGTECGFRSADEPGLRGCKRRDGHRGGG